MKWLVTGASGFIGPALMARLLAEGHDAIGTSRQVDDVLRHLPENADEATWQDAMRGVDVIVHLAGRAHATHEHGKGDTSLYVQANSELTDRIASAALQVGVKRFIYLSTAHVHGLISGDAPFTEYDVPNPQTPYAESKYLAEQLVQDKFRDTSTHYTIFRPPLVYGPGVKANFRSLYRMVERHIPLPFGAIHNARSILSVENLVDAILHAAAHPDAHNETFLITDGVDLSTAQLVKEIAHSLDQSALLYPVPSRIVSGVLRAVGRKHMADSLTQNLQFSQEKFATACAWQPPQKIQQTLAQMRCIH